MTADVSEVADWLADARIAPLVEELLAAVVKQYRVDEAAAHKLIAESLCGDRLRALVESSPSPAAIRRTRVWRDAAAATKRHVYHSLRRYRSNSGSLDAILADLRDEVIVPSEHDGLVSVFDLMADDHASTRERKPHEAEFYDCLARVLGDADSVLDVGCGVQPLRFPFASYPHLRRYVAVDSNAKSIDAVSLFAGASSIGVIRAVRDDLDGGWRQVLEKADVAADAAFDVALLLKLVPVIARQSKRLLPMLAETPARRWIVTGSTMSLAKRTSIRRREQGVLLRFIAQSRRRVVDEFTIGEEFGYVVE